MAVKQNWQFMAHPSWLDTQMVYRVEAEPGIPLAPGPASGVEALQ